MKRALCLLALLAAVPAWAVGEHISVTGPAREQLSETLCISMECGARFDYTIATRVVAGKMELKVLGPSGPRLTLTLPIRPDGRLANSDAMSATSALVQAIEAPAAAKEAAVEKPAKASKQKLSKSAKQKLAKAAKHKPAKPMRVAARKISRG